MKKIIISLFILLSLLCCVTVISSAETKRVKSDPGLLSDREISDLENFIKAAEEECGYELYIYVTSGGFIDETSATLLKTLFNIDNNADAIALHIVKNSFVGCEYGISTYGEAESLSDATINRILDDADVYDNLKSGRLYDGIAAYTEAVPREKTQFEKNSLTAVIVVTVVLALVAGGSTVGVVLYKYKKKLKSPSYPLSKFATMNLGHSADIFLGAAVTKTRINNSSGSGRSGGGGGSFRGKR